MGFLAPEYTFSENESSEATVTIHTSDISSYFSVKISSGNALINIQVNDIAIIILIITVMLHKTELFQHTFS